MLAHAFTAEGASLQFLSMCSHDLSYQSLQCDVDIFPPQIALENGYTKIMLGTCASGIACHVLSATVKVCC